MRTGLRLGQERQAQAGDEEEGQEAFHGNLSGVSGVSSYTRVNIRDISAGLQKLSGKLMDAFCFRQCRELCKQFVVTADAFIVVMAAVSTLAAASVAHWQIKRQRFAPH
jgi:hypothetical protein